MITEGKNTHRIRKPKGERKNTCSKCGLEVEESRKGQRYCRKCHAENMRKNRPNHSNLKTEARQKANCRSYANVNLRRGKIEKKPCEVCGSEESQMHHEDYSKPLEVRWFCRNHHLDYHLNKNVNG